MGVMTAASVRAAIALAVALLIIKGADAEIAKWTTRTVTTTAAYGKSVYAIDLDGDGDMDVLAAADDEVYWSATTRLPLRLLPRPRRTTNNQQPTTNNHQPSTINHSRIVHVPS